MESHMNFMAIGVSTLIPMIVGFIYYNPMTMGNAWMKANGFTKESVGKGPKPIMFLVTLVTSYLLTMFFWAWVTGNGGLEISQVTDAKDGHSHVTFQHGLAHGIIFTITILIPIFASMAIFEKRNWQWALVNIGYWSVTSILMCGILSAWR